MVKWLWTWGGTSFGYKSGDNLWTHYSKHVGKFYGNEIYNERGEYLGELKMNKLITKKSKKDMKRFSFMLEPNRVGCPNRLDCDPSTMVDGYEDFPNPEDW